MEYSIKPKRLGERRIIHYPQKRIIGLYVSKVDVNSLSHSKWNCKYHIVFAPKFRRKVAYGALRQDIANILSMLCKRKGVNIVEAEICPDHVHMLVEIPPNISVASFVG